MLIAQGMFCVARYTHYTVIPIIKYLIATTANKHPRKKSFNVDKNMKNPTGIKLCISHNNGRMNGKVLNQTGSISFFRNTCCHGLLDFFHPCSFDWGLLFVCVCVQRELARQTHEIIKYYIEQLVAEGFPSLRPVLLIGGVQMKEQMEVIKR